MQSEYTPFDYAATLNGWSWDPAKSTVDNLEQQCEFYSRAYRMLASEIRRLEKENQSLREQVKTSLDEDRVEVQAVIDASIAILDPDQDRRRQGKRKRQ